MQEPNHDSGRTNASGRSYFWWLIGGCLAVLLVALLMPRPRAPLTSPSGSAPAAGANATPSSQSAAPARPFSRPAGSFAALAGPTAEEIVTNKVVQFVRSRRKLMHDMAERLKLKVPGQMEQFFDAAESASWDQVAAGFNSVTNYRSALFQKFDAGATPSAEDEAESRTLNKLWPLLDEAYGVAEAAHDWPAQRLLDYGNSILDSLRPGMVYLGGTDAGRYIPTLLNETSEGEHRVVLTQNAFANGSYLEYAQALYGDRLVWPTADDSAGAFRDYLAGAQKRLQHDQDLPNEPKQLRPGEDVRMTDNRLQVSGQVAVMSINDRLVQILQEKNPGVPFAIEQGPPLNSVYAGATPLGPILEMGAPNQPATRNAYAKMASEQGALLLKRDYPSEAEQAFRIATEVSPANSEAVFRYASLLADQQRFDDAIRVVDNAIKAAPDNQQFRDLADSLRKQKQR